MAFTSLQKSIHTVCLLTVVLLVGMHIATCVKGYYYFVDEVQPDKTKEVTYKTYETRLILGMAAAGLTFFTNAIAIILLNKPAQISKLQNIVVFNLTIEVGLGLITAMSIYEMSITRDFFIKVGSAAGLPDAEKYFQDKWDKDGFNLFWRMLIADGILTFVPQIAALIFVYLGVSKQAAGEETRDQITDGSHYNKM